MKIFLIILLIILFVIYGFYMVYRMLIEQTDEYLEESMKRAYKNKFSCNIQQKGVKNDFKKR